MRAGVYWILIALFVAFAKPATRVEAQTLSGGEIRSNLDLPFDARPSKDDGDDEDALETINFYSQQFEGDGFFYVIDGGSMRCAAMRDLRRNIAGFSSRIQFGIVFFDRSIWKFPAGRRPAEAKTAMKSAALTWLRSAQTGAGGSCCRKGFVEALKYANASSASRKVIVYVGDGGGDCDGTNEQVYLNQTLSAVRSQNLQRAQINAVGVLDIGGSMIQAKRTRAARAAEEIENLGGTVSWNPELIETIFRDRALSRITDVHISSPPFPDEGPSYVEATWV